MPLVSHGGLWQGLLHRRFCCPLPLGRGRDARDLGRSRAAKAPSLCPVTVSLAASAGLSGICNRHNPQPLWQPLSTACLAACGAASTVPSLLMHPCPKCPRSHKYAMQTATSDRAQATFMIG